MSNFKVFNTIEKFMKLYEADEDPTAAEGGVPAEGAEGAEAGAPPADGADATQPQEGAENENEPMANNERVEMAQLLIQALQKQPPSPGEIPEDKLKADENNAQDIINFVRSLVALNTSLSLDDETNSNTMAGAIKEI